MPENNEFVLTAYKGLPDNCNEATFTLDFIRNSDKSPQQFNVSIDNNPWSSNPHLPKDGEFTIQEFKVECDNADDIVFPKTTFTPIIVDKDEVPSMHIILTIDVENEKKGIINIGEYRDPWDKSADGLPIIKYVKFLIVQTKQIFQYLVQIASVILDLFGMLKLRKVFPFQFKTIKIKKFTKSPLTTLLETVRL